MAPVWVPLLFGLLAAARMIGNPRLAGLRPVDMIQLVAIGLCFGVALTSLASLARERRRG